MSRYNNVLAEITCPVCAADVTALFFVFSRFGRLDIREYRLGATIRWSRVDSVEQGGRPPGGTVAAKGWAECPSCSCELDAVVQVENDVLVEVSPEPP